jgi:hypothetical protein
MLVATKRNWTQHGPNEWDGFGRIFLELDGKKLGHGITMEFIHDLGWDPMTEETLMDTHEGFVEHWGLKEQEDIDLLERIFRGIFTIKDDK